MPITETGTLPESGKEFILVEEKFKHTLAVLNDPADSKQIEDETYFSAAVLGRRLTIDGKQPTTEEVLNLPSEDGFAIMAAGMRIEAKRKSFRDAPGGAPKDAGSASKTGD